MEPFPTWIERLWDAWDIRVLVLLSFILQIFLTILGSRRKYIARIWIRVVVWCAYLLADWVATVALGKLSQISNNDPNTAGLTSLWAPLLLLHLGGPVTITAYSVEDNQLWVRHLLGLFIQASVATFVILRSWNNSRFHLLTLLMFFAGITKYGERTLALWFSTVAWGVVFYEPINVDHQLLENIPGIELLSRAFFFFINLNPHILSWGPKFAGYMRRRRRRLFSSRSMDNYWSMVNYRSHDVFKITEFELGLMYDVLYTKATTTYSLYCWIIRFIGMVCPVYALFGFSFAAKPANANADIVVTYVLLTGAVVQEIYTVVQIIYSDWTVVWIISSFKASYGTRLLRFLAPQLSNKCRRWSNSMGQCNLLSFCLSDEPKRFRRILKCFRMDKEFKKYRLMTFVDVPGDLKELVLQIIREVEGGRGEWTFERDECLEDFEWSVEKEFDKSITIWHIVTDICYYADDPHSSVNSQTDMSNSKLLSDYMMYLLLVSPSILLIPTENMIFNYAAYGVRKMLRRRKLDAGSLIGKDQACRILLNFSAQSIYNKNPLLWRWGNLLEDAQKLATMLMDKEDKWWVISRVWADMLCYAASQGQVNCHAQHLSRGGEFITHVWLLLAHMKDHSIRI